MSIDPRLLPGGSVDVSLEDSSGLTSQTKIQLSWKNVEIRALPKKGLCGRKGNAEEKVILDDVSGCVQPGEFLSIIGASGAGKTTLLNYLSGRLISKGLRKNGEVQVNGVNRDNIRGLSNFSAYVEQFDILFQTMTVKECLEFAAKLKLPGTLEQKQARVQQIITELKLTKCQNTIIGGPLLKGVSGGERKRTSIGVELITDPYLIFLDEPTTGLDSFTSTSVMGTLQDLANKGKTIVQTIHQPNSEMYEAMDKLMLLAKGKIIYFNKASLAVNYFESINYKCPDLTNPSDYFMSIMSVETIEEEMTNENGDFNRQEVLQIYQERINNFSKKYEASEYRNDPDSAAQVLPISKAEQDHLMRSTSTWGYEFKLLLARNFLNQARLPAAGYVKLIVTVLTALFCIVLFTNVGQDDVGVQQRNGALFLVVLVMSFNAIQNVILIFPDERPVFLREVNNGLYRVSAYFWAKILSEFPTAFLTPIIFGSIIYFPIGLNTELWYKFPLFLIINFLIFNASGGYALILGASISDKQMAVMLTPALIIPFMLFAGFFVNQENIPWYLIIFKYLSIFKYGFQALFLNEYNDLPLDCLTAVELNNRCDPIKEMDFQENLTESMVALLIMYIGLNFIALLVMLRLSKKYE